MVCVTFKTAFGKCFGGVGTRFASELCRGFALFQREGAGEGRVQAAPMVRVQQKARGRTTGTSRTTGLPCAMALRLTPRSPRGPAFLPPSPAKRRRELGISSGMPGPHGLTVRTGSFVGAGRTHAATRCAHRI